MSVVKEVEQLAEVACVANDLGFIEDVELGVEDLDGSDKWFEAVSVFGESRDEGGVVGVKLDLCPST